MEKKGPACSHGTSRLLVSWRGCATAIREFVNFGLDCQGRFLTRLAQPYPKRLCTRWVAAVAAQIRANKLWRGGVASSAWM
eukprot:7502351-Alexandrium_andersonii.AAC.1